MLATRTALLQSELEHWQAQALDYQTSQEGARRRIVELRVSYFRSNMAYVQSYMSALLRELKARER